MQRLFLILLLSVLLASCSYEANESRVVAVSGDELKTLLESDTTHLKALVFYSQACGSCKEMFVEYFKEAIDSCSGYTQFYIVAQDTAFMKEPSEYLSQLGYNGKSYYITSLSQGVEENSFYRIDAIVQSLFPEDYLLLEEYMGLPFVLILSRNNTICTTTYTNGDSVKHAPLYLTKNNLKSLSKNEN